MFWPFKKRGPVVPAPSRFPERSNYAEWMREKVAYYRAVYPKRAWALFSPYTGDYIPIFLTCGFGWNDDVMLEYRKVKRENPDLVALAIKNRPEHNAYVIARIGDNQDFDYNIRLRN